MAQPVTVEVNCGSCGGSGVYHSYQEPEGVGVVCVTCNGSGSKTLTFTPFEGRVRLDNIRTVRITTGALGSGPRGTPVPYEDFFSRGIMPQG